MPRKTPKQMRATTVRVKPEPLARQIREALDPEKASGKVVPFRDMTPEKQAEILAKYRRKP